MPAALRGAPAERSLKMTTGAEFISPLGHENVKTLIRAVASGDNGARSFLFHGPEHCGKSTLATLMAMTLNCVSKKDGLACGECAPCSKIAAGTYQYFTRMSYRFGEIPIDDIREKIIGPTSLMYPPGVRQFFIVDDARFFNQESANCFLKTLEEPNSSVYFILVTSSPASILPTIRSRCQPVRFSENSREVMTPYLAGRFPGIDAGHISFITGATGSTGASVAACLREASGDRCAAKAMSSLRDFVAAPGAAAIASIWTLAYSAENAHECITASKNVLHLADVFDKIESDILSKQYIRSCAVSAMALLSRTRPRREIQAAAYELSSIIENHFAMRLEALESYLGSFKESVQPKILKELGDDAKREITRTRRDECLRIVSGLLIALEKAFVAKASAKGSANGGDDISSTLAEALAKRFGTEEIQALTKKLAAGYYRDIAANVNLDFYLEKYFLSLARK